MLIIDDHLADWDWLTAGRSTIADFGCYPCVALAPEDKIPLAPAI